MIHGLAEYLHQAEYNKIAICSGTTRSEVKIVLDKLYQQEIVPKFDMVITAGDVEYGKPPPEGYLFAVQRRRMSSAELANTYDAAKLKIAAEVNNQEYQIRLEKIKLLELQLNKRCTKSQNDYYDQSAGAFAQERLDLEKEQLQIADRSMEPPDSGSSMCIRSFKE